jgi:hypothetical protein
MRYNLQQCRSDGKTKALVGESFHGGSINIPIVVVESVRRFFGHVECVQLVDLILDAVIDVVVLLVACFFVDSSLEANGRFRLRGVMGENGILWLISCWSLVNALW